MGLLSRVNLGAILRDVAGKPWNLDKSATTRLNRMMDNGNYLDVRLPLRRMFATQETVHPGFAENTANRYVLGAGGVEAPAVVKYQGNFYVTDGHHRLATLASQGKQDARVRLFDADGTTQTEFPLLEFDAVKHQRSKAETDKLLAELLGDGWDL